MSAPTQIEEWVSPLSHLANGESMAALVLAPPQFIPTLALEQHPLPERAGIITTIPDGLVCWFSAYYPSRQGLNTATLSTSIASDTPSAAGPVPRLTAEPPAISGISEEARQISGLPGWLRPVSPLPWSGLSPVGSEQKAARGWMNPEPSYSEEELIEDEDDDEPAFMAHGEFLE